MLSLRPQFFYFLKDLIDICEFLIKKVRENVILMFLKPAQAFLILHIIKKNKPFYLNFRLYNY